MKEEKIKVLALLPMELPKEIELYNTLEAMQNFVGGLIECITLRDTGSEVTLVCNDEGKLAWPAAQSSAVGWSRCSCWAGISGRM